MGGFAMGMPDEFETATEKTVTLTRAEYARQKGWSECSGAVNEMTVVIDRLVEMAGALFVDEKETEARLVRGLAQEFSARRAVEVRRLHGFIGGAHPERET